MDKPISSLGYASAANISLSADPQMTDYYIIYPEIICAKHAFYCYAGSGSSLTGYSYIWFGDQNIAVNNSAYFKDHYPWPFGCTGFRQALLRRDTHLSCPRERGLNLLGRCARIDSEEAKWLS